MWNIISGIDDPVGVISGQAPHFLLRCSVNFQAFFGYTTEQIFGRSLSNFVHDSNTPTSTIHLSVKPIATQLNTSSNTTRGRGNSLGERNSSVTEENTDDMVSPQMRLAVFLKISRNGVPSIISKSCGIAYCMCRWSRTKKRVYPCLSHYEKVQSTANQPLHSSGNASTHYYPSAPLPTSSALVHTAKVSPEQKRNEDEEAYLNILASRYTSSANTAQHCGGGECSHGNASSGTTLQRSRHSLTNFSPPIVWWW